MVGDRGVTALVFDFDGTLYHLPVDTTALRRDLGLDRNAKLGEAFQCYLEAGDTESLDVVTRHERAAVGRGQFAEGARELLAEVTGRYAVAAVTRNSRLAVTDALGPLAEDIFVVGREDVARLKPDPEGLRIALDRFETEPARAVMVGDTFHDVRAARSVGMPSVVVRNRNLAYQPADADGYLETLAELPGWLSATFRSPRRKG